MTEQPAATGDPISELIKLRDAELRKLGKPALVAMLRRGITTPDGRTVRALTVDTAWQKEQLISDILNIEFPYPGMNDSSF